MSLNSHTNFRIKPSRYILGKTSIPGDKSISHRAIILAAIAEGKTRISNFLQGEDTLTTIRIFQKMGVDIENDGNVDVLAVGVDGKIHAFNKNLYLKNGFPFDANTNNEVLALDLLGDESPELIFQDNSE